MATPKITVERYNTTAAFRVEPFASEVVTVESREKFGFPTVEVNWSGCGARSISDAKAFLAALQAAIAEAEWKEMANDARQVRRG